MVAVFLLIGVTFARKKDSCVDCHSQMEGVLGEPARLMKDDRDKNFVAKNAQGTTVNRWITTGMLAASASSSETSYLTWKVARSFGMLVFDNQARV